MSAPPSSRCVANECRRVCGVTRRPGSTVPPYRSTIVRMSRELKGFLRRLWKSSRGPLGGQDRPPVAQVGVDRLDCVVGHRHLAFLGPLAHHRHAAAIEVHAIDREPGDLAHPKSGPVQQLQRRDVAQRHGAIDGREVSGADPSRAQRPPALRRARPPRRRAARSGSRLTTLGRPSRSEGSSAIRPAATAHR